MLRRGPDKYDRAISAIQSGARVYDRYQESEKTRKEEKRRWSLGNRRAEARAEREEVMFGRETKAYEKKQRWDQMKKDFNVVDAKFKAGDDPGTRKGLEDYYSKYMMGGDEVSIRRKSDFAGDSELLKKWEADPNTAGREFVVQTKKGSYQTYLNSTSDVMKFVARSMNLENWLKVNRGREKVVADKNEQESSYMGPDGKYYVKKWDMDREGAMSSEILPFTGHRKATPFEQKTVEQEKLLGRPFTQTEKEGRVGLGKTESDKARQTLQRLEREAGHKPTAEEKSEMKEVRRMSLGLKPKKSAPTAFEKKKQGLELQKLEKSIKKIDADLKQKAGKKALTPTKKLDLNKKKLNLAFTPFKMSGSPDMFDDKGITVSGKNSLTTVLRLIEKSKSGEELTATEKTLLPYAKKAWRVAQEVLKDVKKETWQGYEDVEGTGSRTSLDATEERAFMNWYKRWAEKTGISSDPDDPRQKYDYRAAFKRGVEPKIDPDDGKYHWPSTFKDSDHPNRFVGGIDTITGQPEIVPNHEGTTDYRLGQMH